ncbi:hypothetical protein MBT84_37600 [Streptomyces sp. MBT84]|nr:hypothetical protein [Streptomyces sp. MBT84]
MRPSAGSEHWAASMVLWAVRRKCNRCGRRTRQARMAPQAWRWVPVVGRSMQAGALHQRHHGVAADMDAQAQTEPGVHPGEAVGAAGGGVDAHDGLGQPGCLTRRFDGGRSCQASYLGAVIYGARRAGCAGRGSRALTRMASNRLLGTSLRPAVRRPAGAWPTRPALRRYVCGPAGSSDRSLLFVSGNCAASMRCLAALDLDRLVADAEGVTSGTFPSGCGEIENLTAELGRTAVRHQGLRNLLEGAPYGRRRRRLDTDL